MNDRAGEAPEPAQASGDLAARATAILDGIRAIVFEYGPGLIPQDEAKPTHYGDIVGMWARSLNMFDACIVHLRANMPEVNRVTRPRAARHRTRLRVPLQRSAEAAIGGLVMRATRRTSWPWCHQAPVWRRWSPERVSPTSTVASGGAFLCEQHRR